MVIRPVQAPDLPAVQRLLRAAHAGNLADGFNFTAATITLEALEPRLDPAHFAVAMANGRLVGCIEVKPDEDLGGWSFHLLAVDPTATGGGIGRALVAHAEAQASARGADRLLLDTPETHPWLPAFYERLGYRAVHTVQWEGKHYRSVVMVKDLTAAL
jgi:GNAT superfamily N-acetyltransferase